MSDVQTRRGMTVPAWTTHLTNDDGTDYVIPGTAAVTFSLVAPDATTVAGLTGAVLVNSPDPGDLTFLPSAADTDRAGGEYRGDFLVVWADGNRDTFSIDVEILDPAVTEVITLDEVKTYISVGRAQGGPAAVAAPVGHADDGLLQQLIDAATARIQLDDLAGPILPTTVIERHDGGDGDILLRRGPVASIVEVVETRPGFTTTLTEQAPGSTADGYIYDGDVGELYRVGQGGYPKIWLQGNRNIQVAYVAGQLPIPENVKTALLELVTHWWRWRRGGSATYQPGDMPAPGTSMGYAIPQRVYELLGKAERIWVG